MSDKNEISVTIISQLFHNYFTTIYTQIIRKLYANWVRSFSESSEKVPRKFQETYEKIYLICLLSLCLFLFYFYSISYFYSKTYIHFQNPSRMNLQKKETRDKETNIIYTIINLFYLFFTYFIINQI